MVTANRREHFPGSGKPLVLCADDFALAPGLSEAIVELLARRRLSATGCMSVSPFWPRLGPELASFDADIGLHLTLTDARPLGAMPGLAPRGRLPSLGRLMAAAFSRRLNRAEIRAELRRQLDAFVAVRGRPPDFIDGHQHVHLLAGVREEVLGLFATAPLTETTYLRVCWEPPSRIVGRRIAVNRALVIAALSLPLGRAARALGVRVNDSFRGVIDFAVNSDYARDFPRFLRGPGARPIVMCHPGRVDTELIAADPLTDHRDREYAYFAGDKFSADLQAAGRRIARFNEMESAA